MDDKFEKDVRKALQQGITALNGKIDCFWGKYKDKAEGIKVGKPIRQFYYDQDYGIMKVNIKFTYTPEEIAFLDKARCLSQENLQLVKEYMDELLR
ncbi:MAG: hypothetical protein K2I46_01455 [Clostridia bacterium]|nr:hypothetical protein [Clostridia bacterium]MDE6471543.1 hypothetical protein [Clostridia bacterium]